MLNLHALPFRDELLHFVLMAKVEGDRAMDRVRLFAVAILPHDAVNRHATPHEVKAVFAVLNEIPIYAYAYIQFISPEGVRTANG